MSKENISKHLEELEKILGNDPRVPQSVLDILEQGKEVSKKMEEVNKVLNSVGGGGKDDC